MNKVYITAPLAALVVFIGLFAWSQHGAMQRAAEQKQAALAAHTAKLDAEKTARDAAIAEQLVLNEQRKKDRIERDARETAERAARDAAIDARDTAFRDQERLKRDVERLKREIAVETEIVNRLQIDHDASLSEKAFLEKFVPQAAAQVAELERVLRQIATAEAARLKAAAEATKSKS
jgi:hypothetical protein